MLGSRLTLAIEGALPLPQAGRIAVFAPVEGTDLSALRQERVQVITGFKPDHRAFERLGYEVAVAPEGEYAMAVVCLPRAKAEARALVAQARAVTEGPVVVDGQRDDGVESMLKACRGIGEVSTPISKAHGKLFWLGAGDYSAWAAAPGRTEDGWLTAPGVFSADGVDPASALLAEQLPELSGYGADLGAGWGYLSARVLARFAKVKALDLVEAEHAALDCARGNVTDERAAFHWADATGWRPGRMLDFVIMNPPFHRGRSQDPELGRAFIRAAAGMLSPRGQLFLVANAHLGYEKVMAEYFAETAGFGGTGSFKLLMGERPSRQGARAALGSPPGQMGKKR